MGVSPSFPQKPYTTNIKVSHITYTINHHMWQQTPLIVSQSTHLSHTLPHFGPTLSLSPIGINGLTQTLPLSLSNLNSLTQHMDDDWEYTSHVSTYDIVLSPTMVITLFQSGMSCKACESLELTKNTHSQVNYNSTFSLGSFEPLRTSPNVPIICHPLLFQ